MDLENFPTRPTARDMMDMISPIYDRSYVAKWIFEVMSVPLTLAQDTVADLRNQSFPETATWSLPYWEQSYGIVTNEALSIEERRRAIMQKRNFRKPMNPARIEMLVEELCGRQCELVENVEPHTFEIKLSPGDSTVSLKQVIDLIDEVKQAQKSFRIVFETPVSVRIRAEPRSAVFPYRTTSQNRKTGQHPDPVIITAIYGADLQVHSEGEGRTFPHVVAGTRPDIANIGVLPSLQLQASTLGQGVTFPYPITGIEPDVSNLGEPESGGITASVEEKTASVVYKICGSKRM